MILVNSVYKYVDIEDGERIRVINIEDDILYFVDIDSISAMPREEIISKFEEEIESNKLIPIRDPFIKIVEEKDLSNKQKEKRDESWALINRYWCNSKLQLLDKNLRAKKLNEISVQEGISFTKVKRIFSRYWQRGMNKNSLLPDYLNSGGKGKEKKLSNNKVGRPKKANYNGEVIEGINITDEIKKQFEFVINKYYRNNQKKSLKEIYTALLTDFYSEKYIESGVYEYKVWDEARIPTYHQFYYWFKKSEDIKKDVIFRESENEFNLKNRVILSNSTIETDGPGTRFQVDATIADIYLVSSLNRNRIIGRPVLYAIIDVFSRMITGIYVGLEGPSWIGAMMALDNMVEDKVEYCKRYGISITEFQWPSKHIPEIIIADRGEFEGYSVENLINNLNVKIENTPPYRSDLKGIVERNFRTTNEKLKHKTPGAIQKEYRKRGDRDYRLDAVLTVEEFTKVYINIVLNHNSKIIDKYPIQKEMVESEVIPTPCSLWKWGIENKKGRLKTVDREILRLNILPKGSASISRAGIRFKGLYYSSEKAIKNQWFTNLKAKSVDVVYDPRSVDSIYIPNNNGKEYDICYLTDVSEEYKGCLMDEVIFNQELIRELKEKNLKEQNQSSIDLEKEIENIVKAAKKHKENDIDYSNSKNEKLKGIKKNRAIEKEINREKESFKLGDNRQESLAEVIKLPSSKVNNDNVSKNRLMDKIKKKRGEIGEQQRDNDNIKGGI